MMGPIDQLALNAAYLTRIGILALIDMKGPYRSLHLSEAINNVKVIDDPAEVAVGDIAYGGNRVGRVLSNTLSAGKRIIAVKYGPLDKPVGVSVADWNEDYETNAFITLNHTISVVENTNAGYTAVHNPYDRIASIGAVFARQSEVIYNPAQDMDILLLTQNLIIRQGGPAIVLNLNKTGVTVQKKVNGVNSGSPVLSNTQGIGTVPNGTTAGQLITFTVSKVGFETRTLGPYTVELSLALVSMVPATIQQGGVATVLTFNKPGVSVQKQVNNSAEGAVVVANGAGVASIPNGNTTGQSVQFFCSLPPETSIIVGPFIVLAP